MVGDFFDVGSGKVNFIDNWDDSEVLFDGEIDVGKSLSLNALSGVDDEDGGFDGLEGTGNFVRKIDMAGRIDEV